MSLIFGADKDVAEWVSDKLFGNPNEFGDKFTSIGIVNNGKLIAGIVYNNHRCNSIEMSIATLDPRWATRHNLGALFRYPFTQLNLGRVEAHCSTSNKGAIVFLEKLGFVREGEHRGASYDGTNAYSYSLLKSECRWIK